MDLQQFLKRLEQADQLLRIGTKVSCDLELAAVSRREFTQQQGGKALLFSAPAEGSYPVVTNLFGSEARLAMMLRCADLHQFADKIDTYLAKKAGSSKQRLQHAEAPPDCCETEPGLLVEEQAALQKLPAMRSWPREKDPYLTLALTVTKHPETGIYNLGLYRAQLKAGNRIALNFSTGSGAAQHLKVAKERNKQLPAALVLGADPALLWAAAAPLPEGCDEFLFCHELFASRTLRQKCVSQDLLVPTGAEMIIEGVINPDEMCREGPFGNHTGQYAEREDCPVMRVTALQRKANPLVPQTVVGPPPSENIFLAKANEILLRALLKIDYPEILDFSMPQMTAFHGVSLLKLENYKRPDVMELLAELWQDSPLSRAKLLVFLDEDIELRSFSHCWWRVINLLSGDRIYQDSGRIAIDATGVDPGTLVLEDQETLELLKRHPNN